jgi:isopenicillin-N N-acyltransferase-like protein
MGETLFPRVRVEGGALERGRQYGEQAAERIRRNVEIYRRVFQHYAGWDWDQVATHATAYVAPIAAYRAHFIDEMHGIAAGAGLAFEDVLALNVRTEIMFAAVARAAAGECTAVVALPEATADGHTLLAQNWDWKPDAAETVVLLEAEPDRGPRFITAVEAGLLAKTGMNAAGIGLVTNALVADQDQGTPGVPYHAVLRAILESERMTEAMLAVTYHWRASSANYLIAHRDGEAINAEAAPGDYARVYTAFPEGGIYSHTNHFICPGFDLKDVGLWDGPGSLFRQHRAQKFLERLRGTCDVGALQEILADHFNYPNAICAHPDPDLARVEQYATVFSIVMDLSAGIMWLASGNPCDAEYQEVTLEWDVAPVE